ncbi:hypothetical protein BKA82DRAFT_4359721 [Pisolithus tinctorius]|nr:hypothetical protein BKA82DRAFT_4359721 [Pisolithus tinctorius]
MPPDVNDFHQLQRPNSIIFLNPAEVVKSYQCNDARERVKHLRTIYKTLRDHLVPNTNMPWFLIDFEDAATPQTAAWILFTKEEHSSAIFQDGHGSEVDIWGVGYLIQTSAIMDTDEWKGGVKHPHTIFHTIPIGPQLQALWQHPNTANKMHYCKERTQQVFDKLLANDGFINAFDDIFCGSAYIHGICDGTITPDDTLLMISINGAQLFESRESDC